jgi:hypothetical protein
MAIEGMAVEGGSVGSGNGHEDLLGHGHPTQRQVGTRKDEMSRCGVSGAPDTAVKEKAGEPRLAVVPRHQEAGEGVGGVMGRRPCVRTGERIMERLPAAERAAAGPSRETGSCY